MEKKENTFRKEVESQVVSPVEEMNRNQKVHLVFLRAQKVAMQADSDHLLVAIERFKTIKTQITGMQDCECKTATLEMIKRQIEQNEKALAGSQFNGISDLTLDALERLANLELQIEGQKEASIN